MGVFCFNNQKVLLYLEMAGRPGLGTVVATQEGPTPLMFHFVISEETARAVTENGTFIQVKLEDAIVLGVVQSL
ncbi:MAG: hypothetical protein ACXAD7_21750, partial [Candidatus Kariarchaeaceae archaeon]